MIIGLVLPSTPSYSETFFVNKIKGLQGSSHSVVLFVQTKKSDFKLCPVYTRPKVINNKILQALNILWVILSLFPHMGKVFSYYKQLKKHNIPIVEILKRIYLNSHILKRKLDWLHFGFATQAIGSEMVAKAIKAKMAVSFRGFDINVYPKKHENCYETVWKHVDKIHSISQYLVKQAYDLGLSKDIPVSIITPAIDLETINKVNQSSNTNSEDITISTVARLNWIKDLTTALKTVKILKKTYPDIVYHIVGNGTIKEKERCLFLASQLGIKDNVIFHYQLKHHETLKIVQQSSIYLQTSLNEGFCNALLEAQSLGKLCVATKVGAIVENIIDGETGWLVKPQEPVEIANKIIQVHNLTNDEKLEVITKAKKRVMTKFKLKDQAIAFEDFYNY